MKTGLFGVALAAALIAAGPAMSQTPQQDNPLAESYRAIMVQSMDALAAANAQLRRLTDENAALKAKEEKPKDQRAK